MNQINPHKAGLALGTLVGGLHALWSFLVALGFAQPLLDFIFMAHMIKQVLVVESFGVKRVGVLIIVTTLLGYVIGHVFARVWNYVQH